MAPSKDPRQSRPTTPRSSLPYDMDTFWNQDLEYGAVSIVLMPGDHMDKIQQIATARGEEFESVSKKEVIESPANLMESLRRRARGPFGHADAFFRTSAYTVMLEGPKSEYAKWPRETLRIARLCGVRVVTLSWDRSTNIDIVVAEPEGIVSAGGSSDEMRMAYDKRKTTGFTEWIAPHPLVIGDPTTRQVEAMMRDELKLDFKTDLLDERPVTFLARKLKLNTLPIPPGCDHIDQSGFGWRLTAKDAEGAVRDAVKADTKGTVRTGAPTLTVQATLPIISGGLKVWRVEAGGPPPVGLRTYDVDALSGKPTRLV